MQLEAKVTNSLGIIKTIPNQFVDVSTRKYLLGMDPNQSKELQTNLMIPSNSLIEILFSEE